MISKQYKFSDGHVPDGVDFLRMCGCVEKELVYDYVIKLVSSCVTSDRTLGLEEVEKYVGNRALAYIVLSWLDDNNFLEHGTSIRYGWLNFDNKTNAIEALEYAKENWREDLI